MSAHRPRGLSRLLKQCWAGGIALVLLLASHAAPVQAASESPDPLATVVVEELRLQVPAAGRQAWISAEQGSWQPWLEQQPGFLDRQLFWDPQLEQGLVLIRWADRAQWKAIPAEAVQAVQERFEALARRATGASSGNPFPLVFEGELVAP